MSFHVLASSPVTTRGLVMQMPPATITTRETDDHGRARVSDVQFACSVCAQRPLADNQTRDYMTRGAFEAHAKAHHVSALYCDFCPTLIYPPQEATHGSVL